MSPHWIKENIDKIGKEIGAARVPACVLVFRVSTIASAECVHRFQICVENPAMSSYYLLGLELRRAVPIKINVC
jgi:hypothetical protein